MSNRRSAVLASIALTLTGASLGCSTVHASAARLGKTYPSRPDGCDVRFENLSFQEASAKYEQIGLLTLSGTSDEPVTWDGETRDRLQPKACEIGATVVTPNASANQGTVMGLGTGMIQFAAWHEKGG